MVTTPDQTAGTLVVMNGGGSSAYLHPEPAGLHLPPACWADLQAAAEMVEAARPDVAVSTAAVRARTVWWSIPDPGEDPATR